MDVRSVWDTAHVHTLSDQEGLADQEPQGSNRESIPCDDASIFV